MRELKNVMQRASLLTAGPVIGALETGLPLAGATSPRARRRMPARRNRTATASPRARTRRVAQAAQELGLSRQALYRRMERLGIARG
ncbi:helix-turn-helix domain-containing protein [Janthinobacterium agaricidamnosum]|uniref:helix-turn-helix domain-containing protein n=1 Tax=Janthinobacterium agaricidamnosum TaxID=55508 RepID=UPI001F09230D|nr:helix-turn-helix domain-containing protein [Janthinobacterium agaricidamnosum]